MLKIESRTPTVNCLGKKQRSKTNKQQGKTKNKQTNKTNKKKNLRAAACGFLSDDQVGEASAASGQGNLGFMRVVRVLRRVFDRFFQMAVG